MIKLNAIIVSVDWSNGDLFLLMEKGDILKDTLPEDTQPETLAGALCSEYVDVASSWLNIKLRSVKVDNGDVVITYSCVVPFDCAISDRVSWISTNKIKREETYYQDLMDTIRNIS